MNDYSHHLAAAPRQLDALNNALNAQDMRTARDIAGDLRAGIEGVIRWIDATDAPGGRYPFVTESDVAD